ncbi:TPA: helix-turn-helix domain-containing protein [Streptococcus suis]|nr:helix-turn-helix domain-containing protein [Streptococcus suis]HEM5157623.1 helix-turn-helix domain-containing protein [Streptococcus suis]
MENRIKKFRKLKGIKQNELAQLIGVGKLAMFRYEHSESMPRVDTALKIAEILGVSVENLFFSQENYKPKYYHITAQTGNLTITFIVEEENELLAILEAERLLEVEYELYGAEIIEVDEMLKDGGEDDK